MKRRAAEPQPFFVGGQESYALTFVSFFLARGEGER